MERNVGIRFLATDGMNERNTWHSWWKTSLFPLFRAARGKQAAKSLSLGSFVSIRGIDRSIFKFKFPLEKQSWPFLFPSFPSLFRHIIVDLFPFLIYRLPRCAMRRRVFPIELSLQKQSKAHIHVPRFPSPPGFCLLDAFHSFLAVKENFSKFSPHSLLSLWSERIFARLSMYRRCHTRLRNSTRNQ